MIRVKFLVAMCFLLGFYILDFQVPQSCAMPIQEDKARDNFERMYELITQRLQNLTGDSQSNDQNVRSFVPVNTLVTKNSSEGNQFTANSEYDMTPVDSPTNYMINRGTINTGQKDGTVTQGSLGRVSTNEDSSSFYTNLQVEPPSYDRKNTIYRQASHTNGQQATFSHGRGRNDSYGAVLAGPTVKAEPLRNGYNFQETNDYVNNQRRDYGQSYYAGYQQTQIPAQKTRSDSSYSQSNDGYQQYYPIAWPGYQASSGYQVRYPGYSFQSSTPGNQASSTVTRDKVPQLSGPRIDSNNTTDENVTLQASDGKDTTRVPPGSTIRAKLPPESVEKASFLPKEHPTNEIPSSGSGSDLDETFSVETADQQHSQDPVSDSGSGNEDLSDVAFMLAGTNNVKPQRLVPGLPMNLTRQQALDIYKSALYFAGLMRSHEGLEDLASSGDDFTADDDDDDDSDVSQQTENIDNDDDADAVNLTENDVKEALVGTSGEQESSGQKVKDIEASGSQGEVSTSKAEDKGNEAPKQDTSNQDKDGSKTQKTTKAAPKTKSEAKNKDSGSESKGSEGEVTKVTDAASEFQATSPPANSVAQKVESKKPATSADQEKSSSSDEKGDSGKSTDGDVEVVDSDEFELTHEDIEKEKGDSDKSLTSAAGSKSSPSVANEGYTINSETSNPSADSTTSKGPSITSTGNEALKDDSDMPPPIEVGSPVQTSMWTPQSSSMQPSSHALNAPQTSSPAVRPQTAASLFDNVRQTDLSSPISQRAIVCKDTIQRISCPPQQRIRIQNADYGDTGSVGCLKEANPMPGGMCRTPGAYEAVKRQCEGRELCDLSASNDIFGDTCPDANKYLDVQYDCMNNIHASYPPAVPGYSQASYQAVPQYMNPPPPPVSYAPAPYPYPQAPAVPDLLPASPYVAPDPCSPCNSCAQCSLPVCNTCSQTCHSLTCGPRIPAKLQPLWQQWNERTADMSRMEMSALIISPVPKLLSPTKAPTTPSETAEGSESGESSADEDALYDMDTEKRSRIQRLKTEKKTETSKRVKSKTEQGFLASSDLIVSSGDSSGAAST